MNDFWSILNLLTLILLLASIGVIVHKGIRWLISSNTPFRWDRCMNLIWMLVVIFGLAQIFLAGSSAASRFIFVFLASGIQLYIVIFHYADTQNADSNDSV